MDYVRVKQLQPGSNGQVLGIVAGLPTWGDFSGSSGFSGYSGASGFSGTSGGSGYSGFSGTSGHSGGSGFSGLSGTSGFSGLSGFSGFAAKTPYQMGLGGRLSALASLPVVNLGVEIIGTATTLTVLRARRGVAGSAGTTTIQLEVNGSAIGGATLSWTSSDANFDLKSTSISQAVSAGDYVSFRVTSRETGAEDIYAEAE